PTAAGCPSGTRSAPRARSWPSRPCMSCAGPVAGMRSPPCASAVGRASQRASSGADPAAHVGQLTPSALSRDPGPLLADPRPWGEAAGKVMVEAMGAEAVSGTEKEMSSRGGAFGALPAPGGAAPYRALRRDCAAGEPGIAGAGDPAPHDDRPGDVPQE